MNSFLKRNTESSINILKITKKNLILWKKLNVPHNSARDQVSGASRERGTKMDAAVRHFENFWQFYDLVQVLLCADL